MNLLHSVSTSVNQGGHNDAELQEEHNAWAKEREEGGERMWQVILIILAILTAVIVFGVVALLLIAARVEKQYPYITGKDEPDEEETAHND